MPAEAKLVSDQKVKIRVTDKSADEVWTFSLPGNTTYADLYNKLCEYKKQDIVARMQPGEAEELHEYVQRMNIRLEVNLMPVGWVLRNPRGVNDSEEWGKTPLCFMLHNMLIEQNNLSTLKLDAINGGDDVMVRTEICWP